MSDTGFVKTIVDGNVVHIYPNGTDGKGDFLVTVTEDGCDPQPFDLTHGHDLCMRIYTLHKTHLEMTRHRLENISAKRDVAVILGVLLLLIIAALDFIPFYAMFALDVLWIGLFFWIDRNEKKKFGALKSQIEDLETWAKVTEGKWKDIKGEQG